MKLSNASKRNLMELFNNLNEVEKFCHEAVVKIGDGIPAPYGMNLSFDEMFQMRESCLSLMLKISDHLAEMEEN